MSSYNYSIANDTSNALLNSENLYIEVESSIISPSLDRIDTEDDTMTLIFTSSLTIGEKTTLDALVAAHDGTPNPETPEIEIDDDGRQVQKSAATYKGWRYLAHPIELTTSKLNGCYSKDWTGTDRSDFTMKFYDVNGTELVAGTQAELDTDCVKTEITFAPAYDYDIIGGNVFQHTRPTTDIRMWVIAGAIDLKHLPGTVTEFVGGLNFKFVSAEDHIETDGRASARLNQTTEGVPVPTNKMQYTFCHDAGHQHDIMIVVEYFRP